MEYNFKNIEAKWRKHWAEQKTFKPEANSTKPKYYVLDMFPYPSGAGLHVGHPLGYIASDIYARYKRLKGFNVLHPMGYDAFGLPAEQYAIQTGQHPAITTETNISRYREQLDKIGFSFDWDREVRTCEPNYYKWTQWIFKQIFNSWYCTEEDKAKPIDSLVARFRVEGNLLVKAVSGEVASFTATEWSAKTKQQQEEILLSYRLAFRSETLVNWCAELGTVLANDEIKDGLSERGGHPVEQKKMMQWSLRITAYAQRLINDLNALDWTEAIKEQQRNWIGRSQGASIRFEVVSDKLALDEKLDIEVFTTRPDTIFGVSYMTLAPEHEFVARITTDDYKIAVSDYINKTKKRSERDRMSDVKTVSGQFTGAYVTHPFTGDKIPVWIGDYVLASYGTGAVMAVPAHDTRDFVFAKHYNIPMLQVISGGNLPTESHDGKEGELLNSSFLNGLQVKDATATIIAKIEERGIGKGKIQYRLRDAIFSRQRYWGEPFPIYYEGGLPKTMKDKELPLNLPAVEKYLPTKTGEPPLARAENWKTTEGFDFETNTMPGWAGSSWYFLRYMDANNKGAFVSKDAESYWKNVDLYIGGSEHATGHLLYSRFWMKFLYDLGFVSEQEPFKKMINQGMILGRSNFVYRIKDTNKFVSHGLKDQHETTAIHVDVNIVENDVLDLEKFKLWRAEYKNAEFILEENSYKCGAEVEKMSKSKFNVVSPDLIVEKYGADTLRMYEMFLGPLEQFKPWNTNGISGVNNFLRKFWRLFHNDKGVFLVSEEKPSTEELKILHKTIKKVQEDIEGFSFNTSVSTFMVCVNELTALRCNKREVLEPLILLMCSYAPHISEELWMLLGHKQGVSYESFPKFKPSVLIESSHNYPVSFNGKMRFKEEYSLDLSKEELEMQILAHEKTIHYLNGLKPKKIIIVPKKIINIVL
ncbi:MAG: leucine--tRNA ligase [Flavobacteriales bacterium]|nr:leucine--tRNA ligase [Flavobacteriales bacterium]MDG1396457.1 leucine--tRNA ligase [Flavobacteriales bacterium]